MKIMAKAGTEDVAVVYIAELQKGKFVEFVEAVQPPIPREKKWVLIVSSMYGCPVGCRFCDSGKYYQGIISKEGIFEQIDYLVKKRFPAGNVNVDKFKIQFARMGDPAFNNSVLEVLEELPEIYTAPGLLPTISTIAPQGTDGFFEKLLEIKTKNYKERFQLQFSIHTTDEIVRDWLIPVKKWDFKKISKYGEKFYNQGDRKITLNFALAEGMSAKSEVLLNYFDPDKFLIKITPVNPTHKANENNISSHILPGKERYEIVESLKNAGYTVILSIGELEENLIGSNCGQHIMNFLKERKKVEGGYTYSLQNVEDNNLVCTDGILSKKDGKALSLRA